MITHPFQSFLHHHGGGGCPAPPGLVNHQGTGPGGGSGSEASPPELHPEAERGQPHTGTAKSTAAKKTRKSQAQAGSQAQAQPGQAGPAGVTNAGVMAAPGQAPGPPSGTDVCTCSSSPRVYYGDTTTTDWRPS